MHTRQAFCGTCQNGGAATQTKHREGSGSRSNAPRESRKAKARTTATTAARIAFIFSTLTAGSQQDASSFEVPPSLLWLCSSFKSGFCCSCCLTWVSWNCWNRRRSSSWLFRFSSSSWYRIPIPPTSSAHPVAAAPVALGSGYIIGLEQQEFLRVFTSNDRYMVEEAVGLCCLQLMKELQILEPQCFLFMLKGLFALEHPGSCSRTMTWAAAATWGSGLKREGGPDSNGDASLQKISRYT